MSEVVTLHQGELALDPAVAERCEQRLALARTHMAAGFYHWLEAGKQFAAIKTDVGRGNWVPWLRDHTVSRATADLLVRITERFDPILLATSKLETDEWQIDFEALRLLAYGPVSAAAVAVDLAAAGKHITREEADELIAKARADEAARALAEGRERTAAEVEAERRRTAREIAKATKAVEAATGKATKAELKSAELTVKLAELRASRKQEIEIAQAEVTERYKGKLVVTEEEIHQQVAILMRQSDKTIGRLEKQLATANSRLGSAQDEAARLRKKLEERTPPVKHFDSDLSLRAMSVQQAIAHLRQELKISPQQCIAIETEMATRIHGRPALAREKFLKMATAMRDILPWFETFLKLYGEGSRNEGC